jgi:uncharacterized protein (TIGR03435 family)
MQVASGQRSEVLSLDLSNRRWRFSRPDAYAGSMRLCFMLGLYFLIVPGPLARPQGGGQGAGGKISSFPGEVAFDVMSIRPSKAANENSTFRRTADGFEATNVTIPILIQQAFRVRLDLIQKLPAWATVKRFDVKGKVLLAGDEKITLSPNERAQRLAASLQERFSLKVHSESQVMSVYNLDVGSHGTRIMPHGQGTVSLPRGVVIGKGVISNKGDIQVINMPLSAFTDALSTQIGRSVIDCTGLTGNYDLVIKWSPRDESAAESVNAQDAPDIFTAVKEQLGLELHPGKGPVQVLVVDNVTMPSEN